MTFNVIASRVYISIHALLAESDGKSTTLTRIAYISIHALLAESDSIVAHTGRRKLIFLSTLSLRRATPNFRGYIGSNKTFLSTLSLRRATCYSLRYST